ncbi:MAG TPA: efflux RND transporter periplasmic adaptor subunit, partial [Croceibacterium sp.]|nr:efflux RND transporter periplasmic adaptor subunit [Croceibacterium sp.]
VVGSDNRVRRRSVTPGLVTGDGIAVTAGLTGTERVVERAGQFLNDGDQVKAVVASRGARAAEQ